MITRNCFLLFALGIFLVADLNAQEPSSDAAFQTKVFKIPAGFFEGFSRADKIRTIQNYLEENGVVFSEGTTAIYDPGSHRIAVTHRKEGIAEVKRVLDAFSDWNSPKQIQLRVELFEVDALAGLKIQQQVSEKADHSVARDFLAKAAETGGAKIVSALSLVTRSGQRGKVADTKEVIYSTEFEWDESGDISIPVLPETREVGTIFESDPVLGADDVTIDINVAIEHHTAPPIYRNIEIRGDNGEGRVFGKVPEFHAKTVSTQLTMHSGDSVLVGSWKPTGKPEYEAANLVHLVFVTGTVVWKKAEEVP